MKNEHLFISDVHLGAFTEEENNQIEQDLIALVRYGIQEKAHLYILGDLFDYWMEFPGSKFIPELGKEVLGIFQEYNRFVQPAIYITGNHDYWTISHFKELGFEVEHDLQIIQLDELKAMLFHGDAKFNSNGQLQRPLLHRVLRNESFLAVFRKLFPNEKGLQIMKRFSSFTRLRNEHAPKPLSLNAKWIIENKNAQLVLCGHDHIPRTETYSSGTYINLGTFFNHRTIARYYENEIALVEWKSESQEFVPFTNNVTPDG